MNLRLFKSAFGPILELHTVLHGTGTTTYPASGYQAIPLAPRDCRLPVTRAESTDPLCNPKIWQITPHLPTKGGKASLSRTQNATCMALCYPAYLSSTVAAKGAPLQRR